MKVLKKLSALFISTTLAISSLFLITLTGSAHAAGVTRYWCNVTGGNFSTATNWNTASDCTSGTTGVPANGDSLVFDNSNLTADTAINDDIAGLAIGTITFQGTSASYGYSITAASGSDSITLSGGITDNDNVTEYDDSLNVPLTLSAPQTFLVSTSLTIGSSTNSFNIGTNNLTVSANSQSSYLSIDGPIVGSGNIVVTPNENAALSVTGSSPTYTGTTNIGDNSFVVVNPTTGSDQPLGTGPVLVGNDASLQVSYTGSSFTLANDLTFAGGNGLNASGALISCLSQTSHPNACTTANTTLTLSGAVNLTADTQVANGAYVSGSPAPTNSATIDFTGTFTPDGFTMSPIASSNTILEGLPASASGSSSSGSKTTPKTPDTGLAAVKTNPIALIVITTISAASLVLVARRLNQPKKSK